MLSSTISNKCGEDLEVTVPRLWKPRMIIYNLRQEITADNLEDTLLSQNLELGIGKGDIVTKFKYKSKRGQINMVVEVGSETRKKLLGKKLKLGWLTI
jgi:hypothetical protein